MASKQQAYSLRAPVYVNRALGSVNLVQPVQVQQALIAGSKPALRKLLSELSKRAPLTFRPQGLDDGGMLVTNNALFPKATQTFVWQSGVRQLKFNIRWISVMAEFLRQSSHSSLRRLHQLWPLPGPLTDDEVMNVDQSRGWPRARKPGIYRREHASLLIRSATTGILLDPVGLMSGAMPLPPARGELDAIVITHSHGDHWHLASLLACAGRADVPVLVPRVRRRNLLCPTDFTADLRACKQATRALGWGQRIRIGDIDIEALPFYGEQPTHDAPGPDPGLRSWGNCYRFTTPQFSCIVLVDGGTDPLGSTAEAMQRSYQRSGPVDAVLACQREFGSPFFGGLASYWASLPYRRLIELAKQARAGTLPSTTGGARGAVDACTAVGARFFLPYANGYAGRGAPIRDIGWGTGEPTEADRNAFMAAEFQRRKLATQVVAWNPGDVAVFNRTGVSIERA